MVIELGELELYVREVGIVEQQALECGDRGLVVAEPGGDMGEAEGQVDVGGVLQQLLKERVVLRLQVAFRSTRGRVRLGKRSPGAKRQGDCQRKPDENGHTGEVAATARGQRATRAQLPAQAMKQPPRPRPWHASLRHRLPLLSALPLRGPCRPAPRPGPALCRFFPKYQSL